jgi:hypothetical protein
MGFKNQLNIFLHDDFLHMTCIRVKFFEPTKLKTNQMI